MVEKHLKIWILLQLHAKWPTVIWRIPSLIWITKTIAKPLLQFSSSNTLQPTQQSPFIATWDSPSWTKMENRHHNEFPAPSKSATKMMPIACVSAVATIQMDLIQLLLNRNSNGRPVAPWRHAQNTQTITRTMVTHLSTLFQHFENELPYFL